MLRDNKCTNHPSTTSGYTSSTRNTTTPVRGISGKLKSPYFYTLASVVILTILSILVLNLRLSLANATGSEGGNDTGVATLSRVGITQAGTGQSVTIDGTTLDEEGENNEVDNAKRRTILNNNVVRYRADLQVSTPGSLTLSITLPANNTIDEATIGSAQGCIAGSKLEAVTVDGKKSYTNNKATCVMNATSIGQVSWGITAYLWGGNNTKIQPTISLSGQEQSQKPDPITVIGKGNYSLRFSPPGYNPANKVGYNTNAAIDFSLYIPGSSDNALLGVEPINKYSVVIDMTNMPDNTEIYSCGGRLSLDQGVTPGFGHSYADYKASCQLSSNEKRLTITIDNIVTAIRSYSTYPSGSNWHGLVYVENGVRFAAPTSSLTDYAQRYYLTIDDTAGTQSDGAEAEIGVVGTTNSQITYSLNKAARGSTNVWQTLTSRGWSDGYAQYGPVYVGESFGANPMVTTRVLEEAYAKNYYGCMAWNVDSYHLDRITEIPVSGLSVEYGVIKEPISSTGLASQCGQYGDSQSGTSFFSSLDGARDYAKDTGASVNAIRFYINRLNNGTNKRMLTAKVLVSGGIGNSGNISIIGKTDNWLANQSTLDARIVPGLFFHTITAVPSSNAPNTTDHVTITPKTYNRDTNVKITTTLPKGLTYQSGSFRVGSHQLSQGLDYDIAKQSDGSTVITFNMDQIASIPGLENIVGEPAIMPGEPGNDTDLPIAKDNNGNGIVRDVIGFDVLVDSNVPTPSTLTITSQVSGTGTNYAASTFRTASTSVTISQARVFGYNLTSSASSLNVNEDLTYVYSNYNLTDDDIANLDTISVLPYNDDSRGSYGLTSYNLSSLTVASSDKDLSLPTIYYTTDPTVRELERTNPAELATDSSITWIKCNLDAQGRCTNLPNVSTSGDADAPADGGVAAVRWQLPNFAKGAQYYINLTINDLDAESAAKLANDITYVSADGVVAAAHQSPTTTSYVGESLGLRMDTANLAVALNPNDATTLTNHLTILSNTRHGYNLTINMAGDSNDLVGQSSGRTIPAINAKPRSGTTGWSISTDNSEWQSVPTATNQGLLLYSNAQSGQTTTNLPVTYGFSTTESTVADTYQGQVVYTLVGI